MGSYRSKEDDVAKIYTSIFVTNFPEKYSAKDLFNICKQYGHVVDAFIPLKKSKVGKRFGFVRFINVFSVERLYAQDSDSYRERYVICKRSDRPVNHGSNDNDIPALVLEDDCVMSKDLSNCLFGRVKEFVSLANIKLSLNNEGFMNLKISYMGEKWIMPEFVDSNAMNLFRENVSVGSWFSQIIQASTDFVSESRIAWVEIEGIPLKLWSENTFKRIATKWGVMLDIEDQEDDCFHSKRICMQTNSQRWISDEFKIIFRGKVFWIRAKETPGWVPDFTYEDDEEENSEVDSKEDVLKVNEQNSDVFSDVEGVPKTLFEQDETSKKLDEVKKSTDAINQEPEVSLKYPPGFTPKAGTDGVSVNDEAVNDVNNVSGYEANVSMNAKLETGSESACSGHFKKSNGPRSGGSILDLLDDVVKVGQASPKRPKKIGFRSCALKISDSVGNLGGILCVWDPNAFSKDSVTVSDYFILVRGVWQQNGMDLLLIVVYAPHDAKEKVMLWDYLAREIIRWKGKVVFMVWAGQERFLSDHRPILLREHHLDYGPIPFRFFHYWCEMDGFHKLVADSWMEYPNNEACGMLNFMGKLKFLKSKIRIWNKLNMVNRNQVKDQLKSDLEAVENMIDSGNGNEEVVSKRMDLVKNLQHINNLKSMEMAQKAKVKWAVEGDENSSFISW
ncbi:RNA-directed DNA polymerase, eukaryota [Tanacetum coccineum]